MLRAAMSEHEQRFELLADLGAMIAGEVELDDLLATFAARVARALGADRATLWLIDNATGEIRSRVATLPELAELRVPSGHGVVGHVAQTGELMNNRDVGSDPRWAEEIAQRIGYPVTSMLTAPIVRRGQIRGVLQVLNKRQGAFTDRDEEFTRVLAEQIGRALDYTTLRGDDASRGLTLRGRFNHVIGRSPEMAAVYEMIVRAAQTDATVLLHGETGTGKGLLARAIHVNSARREAPFVHVDCTTLPAALVESELFGHERGAYTGADSRVIGKVEAADKGTLFLDELGELPLPLQGKLLRFVQDRQFERVGGRETLTADVRIVAATNRDLAAMTSAGAATARRSIATPDRFSPMLIAPSAGMSLNSASYRRSSSEKEYASQIGVMSPLNIASEPAPSGVPGVEFTGQPSWRMIPLIRSGKSTASAPASAPPRE
jgi:Nif-specific regulatory protein